MKARLIEAIGKRVHIMLFWGDDCSKGSHSAKVLLAESEDMKDKCLNISLNDVPEEKWPAKCDHCGEVAPVDAKRSLSSGPFYNTESGNPEPGDLYFLDHYRYEDGCFFHDNCDGVHLFAMLPNGRIWDIDSRASNCTDKKDKKHRCWVRHGSPPNITVDKNGHTCQAGAGSIGLGDYHGFLRNGVFVTA